MAWNDPKSANGWLVYTEDVTLDTSATDQSTSYVDFIPYGRDWYLEVNQSATLATLAEVDIDMCYESDGTYWELCTTGCVVSITDATSRDLIDVSSKGCAPYYKFRLDKTAALTAATTKSVKFTVLVPPKTGVIY